MSLPCKQMPADIDSKLEGFKQDIADKVTKVYQKLKDSATKQLSANLSDIRAESHKIAEQGRELQSEANLAQAKLQKLGDAGDITPVDLPGLEGGNLGNLMA